MEQTIKKREWGPETAEKVANEACVARGLSTPSDFIRFSEAAVFRSENTAVRVDQGHQDRITGDNARKIVLYMRSVGVSTIKPAEVETYVSEDGYNVTFYDFMAEGDDTQWEELLFGFGAQIRKIHDLVSAHKIKEFVPSGVETNYAKRKIENIVEKLNSFYTMKTPHCLEQHQVGFLLQRAELLKGVLLPQNSPGTKVVLHGDAHLGNATLLHDGVCVYDFEEIGFGEPFLDHLHMLLADKLFNIPSVYEPFSAGYQKSFDGIVNLDEWLEVAALIYIVWSAGLGAVSEKHKFETVGRFRTWDEQIFESGLSTVTKNDVPFLWNAKI